MKDTSQQQSSPQNVIGRSAQIRRLTSALERAEAGIGGALLITGPAGIGKTYLVEELMGIARRRGHMVLYSRAYPLEQHVEFAPVISSLEALRKQLNPTEKDELAGEWPSVTGLEKSAFLQRVARLVERLAERRPVLWFLDDLHWADLATVDLFRHLAHAIRNQRVLLVAAHQNAVSDTLRYIRLPLHAMVRAGLSEEISLDRLDPEQVATLARRTLGARPSRTLLDYLESRAAGNPLLVQSLLLSLSAEGFLIRSSGAVTLTPAVLQQPGAESREIILQRVAHLDMGDRRVLDLLSVMGGTSRQVELAGALGIELPELRIALGRLERAGLVQTQEADDGAVGWISLTHPLFQEVLYAELPAAWRQRYHAQVAAVLERLSPLPIGLLVHEYEGSGTSGPDPDRALQFLLQAAERAAVSPARSAPHYYRAALALVRGGLSPELLASTLLTLGQSLAKAGEFVAAREALSEALLALEEVGDTVGAGRMHVHLAYVETGMGHVEAAGSHVEEGIARLSGGAWNRELLILHGLRCSLDLVRNDTSNLSAHAATLGEAAEALQTAEARAWHLHARTWEAMLAAQVRQSVDLAAEGLEQAWQSQDPLLIGMNTADRAITLLLRGDHRAAATEVRTTLALLPKAYWVPISQLLSPLLTMAEAMAGNWEAALQVSDESVPLESMLPGISIVNRGARAILLIRQGELDQARTCLAEGSADRPAFLTDFDYATALLALESGEYERAVEAAIPLAAWGLAPLGLALLAEAQAALGESDVARQVGAALTALGDLDLPLATAVGAWAEGLGAGAAGEAATACEAFAQAAEQFDRLAMPFDAARARFEHAKGLAAKDLRVAVSLARKSLKVFTDLGAHLWTGRVREWLGERARRTGAAKGAATSAPAPEVRFSEREREILRLLDEGLSDAEIAERLVISRRTVGNHLERMYSRHGVKSRLALVRFARANGALGEE